MESFSGNGGFDVTRADGEVAEAFARFAFPGEMGEDRAEGSEDLFVGEAGAVEFVHAFAVETRAEVEIVFAGGFADEADLTQVGAAAAVIMSVGCSASVWRRIVLPGGRNESNGHEKKPK
jgi:hypothetical protein